MGGTPPTVTLEPGQSGGTSFHAETHLEYFGLLRAGDILDVRTSDGRSWEKHGARGGRLWFFERIVEYSKNQDLIVRSTTVGVRTEHKIDTAGAVPKAGIEGTTTVRSALESTAVPSYPVPIVGASDLAVGDAREMVLVDNLTRGQILLYARRFRGLLATTYRRDMEHGGSGLSHHLRPRHVDYGHVRPASH